MTWKDQIAKMKADRAACGPAPEPKPRTAEEIELDEQIEKRERDASRAGVSPS